MVYGRWDGRRWDGGDLETVGRKTVGRKTVGRKTLGRKTLGRQTLGRVWTVGRNSFTRISNLRLLFFLKHENCSCEFLPCHLFYSSTHFKFYLFFVFIMIPMGHNEVDILVV